MDPVVFVPLALVGIFALVFPARLKSSRIIRYGVACALGALFVRYIIWRLTVTVLPADQFNIQGILVWTMFGIEVFAWFDASILFATLCRHTERSDEADTHEARLRAMAPVDLPDSDVFITTYN